jgi:hypothetical protein
MAAVRRPSRGVGLQVAMAAVRRGIRGVGLQGGDRSRRRRIRGVTFRVATEAAHAEAAIGESHLSAKPSSLSPRP